MFFKKKIKVVTHDGGFHADDVFAVASLMLLEPNKKFNILRTRDKDEMETSDYVIDVGGEYNPEKNKFDHHQNDENLKRKNGIPYSSFGLIWKHFGEQISGSREVADEIDIKLVQGIDLDDNGIDFYKSIFLGVYPKTLASIIGNFNISRKFLDAVDLAKIILENQITTVERDLEEIKLIQKYRVESKYSNIIVCEKHVGRGNLTKVCKDFPEIIFAIAPERENTKWKVTVMKDDINSFVSRLTFPKEWHGKRGMEFAKISGVSDALFCHKSGGFIAVAKSKEGAIELAKKALKENDL